MSVLVSQSRHVVPPTQPCVVLAHSWKESAPVHQITLINCTRSFLTVLSVLCLTLLIGQFLALWPWDTLSHLDHLIIHHWSRSLNHADHGLCVAQQALGHKWRPLMCFLLSTLGQDPWSCAAFAHTLDDFKDDNPLWTWIFTNLGLFGHLSSARYHSSPSVQGRRLTNHPTCESLTSLFDRMQGPSVTFQDQSSMWLPNFQLQTSIFFFFFA